MIVWALTFYVFTPKKVAYALDILLSSLITAVVLVGVSLSVVGLMFSTSKFVDTSRRGLNIELAGLWIAMGGPVSYFITQFYLSFGLDGDQRIALTTFAYCLCAFMLVRIVIVSTFRGRRLA